MNNNELNISEEVIESSNNDELNDDVVKRIAKRILELESLSVNKNANDDEMKKKIMSIIEEEIKNGGTK